MYIIYGIPNCGSVKRARTWLEERGVDYQFHDYKKEGVTKTKLTNWCKQVGWEVLVNKKGTTWRSLSEEVQRAVTNQSAAIALMSEQHSVIKRPVIEKDGTVIVVGFDEEKYSELFEKP